MRVKVEKNLSFCCVTESGAERTGDCEQAIWEGCCSSTVSGL